MSNNTYKDINKLEFEHFRLMRNRAGEYIAKAKYALAFEAILDMKRDVKAKRLHPSMFYNLLEESLAIGCELSGDKAITLANFERYLKLNYHKLLKV